MFLLYLYLQLVFFFFAIFIKQYLQYTIFMF